MAGPPKGGPVCPGLGRCRQSPVVGDDRRHLGNPLGATADAGGAGLFKRDLGGAIRSANPGTEPCCASLRYVSHTHTRQDCERVAVRGEIFGLADVAADMDRQSLNPAPGGHSSCAVEGL
jgi:hypothetical protein